MQYAPPPPGLAPLREAILAGRDLPQPAMLATLAEGVARSDPMQALAAATAPAARPAQGYSRHVAYADPDGLFTIVYLVWPPRQFSPVHGHHTWCAYRVVKGELAETLYRWDAASGCARPWRRQTRRQGDIVTAGPGLEQIHRLGNAGDETAVSLHVYGVGERAIATGVNRIVSTEAGRHDGPSLRL
ncbi:hypothetical protein CAL14_04285 [Bordetella genomosp. 9]|uniref:cysteine dioxygenase family protein n=1 Tax=Bordetella genomosp. 9 TaxID=1416803 RepID=UPI000A28FF6F|nr:cysteine dioxygenase family protein [Bordetella genomosp. 9]ARP89598.1 hypothetical protein CAL14_04285 [Bordetella genomosp. 9]